MDVLHTAVLAQRQTFAGRLQGFGALFGLLARFKALGGLFVCLGHGAMAGNVGLDFFGAVLGKGSPGQAQGDEEKGCFFHVFRAKCDLLSGASVQLGQQPTTAAHIVTQAPGVKTCF
jgi:hypothetical protein